MFRQTPVLLWMAVWWALDGAQADGERHRASRVAHIAWRSLHLFAGAQRIALTSSRIKRAARKTTAAALYRA